MYCIVAGEGMVCLAFAKPRRGEDSRCTHPARFGPKKACKWAGANDAISAAVVIIPGPSSLTSIFALQGRRVALRGVVPAGAAHPLRRLRPPHRREGGRSNQVRKNSNLASVPPNISLVFS